MYFKRLEMHGFKSFAEPQIIEFHEGVTCIVGPNGSGKSNISDAIRWVLGEQSPKALRGGKMEEVIFAGTANRKSRGMAEVTLVIDNSTHILDIDYNEVAITRRMFRSGESEYLINNNQCRLRDIRELIMDTGIGVDGYSLIGQGKIADIVSNKPESRREIFEEAAGVVMYKSKKAETERHLAASMNNLERQNDIIGEIEGRIDNLKEDSEKAAEYLALKERYKSLEINITLRNIDNITNRNTTYKSDIKNIETQLQEINDSRKESEALFAKKREDAENLEILGNENRDKVIKLINKINRLTNESQLNQEKIAGLDRDDERLSLDIDNLKEKLDKEEKNQAELLKTKETLEKNIEEADEALAEYIDKFNIVSRESSDLANLIDNEKNALFNLSSTISAKKSEANSYESIITSLQNRKRQLSEDIKNSDNVKSGNKNAFDEAKKQRETLSGQLQRLTETLNSKIQEKNSLLAKRKSLNVDLEDTKIQGSQKVARKKTIEEMESNYEGYNYAVKYIMRSNTAGIDGVVSDCMSVPKGYETAIETALGSQLQNIICDTDATAKKAVNMLKESKAGRLTFLPLSSVNGQPARLDSRITGDSGFSGMASDIVSFDAKYQGVFNYLLGRVVITKDMDSAIRLSKINGAGVRFVTLDGEIINASGAITGGKYKNKTANLLERKGEIESLEKEINRLTAERKRISDELDSIREKNDILDKEITELNTESQERKIQLSAVNSRIESLQNILDNAESDSQKINRELESIDKEVSNAENLIKTIQQEVKDFSAEITAKNKLIEEKLVEFEEKKSASESVSEEITKRRIEAGDWASKSENLEELLTRIEDSIDDYRFQIEDKQLQIEANNDERNLIMFGEEKAEDCGELIEEKKQIEQYIQEVTEKRSRLLEEINEYNDQQKDIVEKINSYQDQKYQLEIKIAKDETQVETMKERLFDEFEMSYAQALDFRIPDFVMSTSVKESREIRNRMRELGDVNVGAIAEYQNVSERYKFLITQRADLMESITELRKIIADTELQIRTRFKENFDKVVINFEKIFQDLFGGGHAELRMEDENNPLESGIDIVAQPPGKKLQNITLMSGGEKTMTAIALMFAVLKTKPTPFCILDEVEAALDDANIDRFAKYLRHFQEIQFALITHQKATMEHADVLYGVTMPERGISKVLSLRLGDDFEL